MDSEAELTKASIVLAEASGMNGAEAQQPLTHPSLNPAIGPARVPSSQREVAEHHPQNGSETHRPHDL